MARLEGANSGTHVEQRLVAEDQETVRAVREMARGLLIPEDDGVVWALVQELYRLDIANLTPVEALVFLNNWQGRLRNPG
jgi:hypothetical protein